MRKLGGWITLTLGLVLLAATGVGSCAAHSQLRRDRECVANVQQQVNGIEAFRTQNGRLPRREELRGGGMALIDFRIAPGGQYELAFWRGERSVRYASATGRNTCDSGALQAALWIAALLFPPAVTLLLWAARLLRAAREVG
jgi:hypothetical protein